MQTLSLPTSNCRPSQSKCCLVLRSDGLACSTGANNSKLQGSMMHSFIHVVCYYWEESSLATCLVKSLFTIIISNFISIFYVYITTTTITAWYFDIDDELVLWKATFANGFAKFRSLAKRCIIGHYQIDLLFNKTDNTQRRWENYLLLWAIDWIEFRI